MARANKAVIMLENTGSTVGPIVAIGASAGGLEALCRLFELLPATRGMAFIVVQHLDPTHQSMMVELLAAHTAMPVAEASEGAALLGDHVYIIPPGRYLSVRGGLLHLTAPDVNRGARLPFDHLLQSLAQWYGPHTIAVILTGTGGDGSTGLRAIKQAGGAAIAQKPEDAEFAGMPQSAIATGLVDRIVPLADMPKALFELAARPPSPLDQPAASYAEAACLDAILTVIKDRTAHDFHAYKPGTINRRIERRMGLRALRPDDLTKYLDLLRRDQAECEALMQDLLINVTSFFRDPKVFETLQTLVIPDVLGTLGADQALRVWIAGCSTGEEAYSMAMVCSDAIAASGRHIKLQIFASDLDADAVGFARDGVYPLDIANVVSADRLARFFTREKTVFRATPALRGHIVFTVQDVLADPPFSRIDLISCRNLLIYLNLDAQAKAIELFHFALNDGGILVLGSAETIGRNDERFEPMAKATCCFRQLAPTRPGGLQYPLLFANGLPLIKPNEPISRAQARQASLAQTCSKAVLASHAPAAVLINRRHECLYSMGPTHRYLRVAPGYASLDLLTMASPALRTKLRLAIDRAGKAEPRVDGGRARITTDHITIWFRIDVQWLNEANEDLLLVCFIEDPGPDTHANARGTPADGARIAELERELEAAHDEVADANQSRKIAEQEQKSINEESLSVNEEFQSTNEELLTSKEELQALNEELTALNSQLQKTLERQRQASDDLQNVLYSTNVGTMFLDIALKIRFFTPAITLLFAVIPGDVGRPLSDLRPIADDPDLISDARRVLAEEAPIDREVNAPNGAWFLRRIFPYRAHDNHIEGVVITFSDITQAKAISRALGAAKLEAERANIAKSRFLAAASHDLRQPLQSLTLLTGLLVQAVDGPRESGLLKRVEQTLHAMSGMLDALLNINQIEAGVIKPRISTFPLSDVFDHLRDEFTYIAQARRLSLRVLPGSALVSSDPHLLDQIMRNLLGNAIKYTTSGKVLVGCRRHGSDVRIEVWDTGIGIRSDQLAAIFEEFHQVDTPAHETSGGLGLGLSIVQRLGKLLGYPVDVRSVPGRGSTFTITVPGATMAALPEPVTPPDLPRDIGAGHGVILVVEDDPDVLDLLKQVLRPQGHVVHGASNAAEAITLIREAAIRPDILLTDYNLPDGVNGIDLLGQLRTLLNAPLPAVILTGDISTNTMARISGGNCTRLDKPVDPRRLIQAIARLCPPDPAQPATAPAEPVANALAGTDAKPAATAVRAGAVAYVVDDDAAIRDAVRDVLETQGVRVEDFDCAETFLASYRPGSEGCLLLDAHMPGMSGLELLATLRARQDFLPVILITGGGDIALAVAAMRAGASNFLEKPVGRAEILACVDQAVGQSHDTRVIDANRSEAAARVATLTPRQREVLRRVLAGEPSKNIAADLDISQRTVENHRSEIMHKMKVRSIPELVKLAIDSEAN
jgi:two-component system CheB/CheR fusion protein